MSVMLYTSINPNITRLIDGCETGFAYQFECIDTWRSAGFEIISLNSEEEISRLHEAFPFVSFRPIAGRKPKISEFIEEILKSSAPVAGIVNSDVLFIGAKSTASAMCRQAEHGLILLERMNISPNELTATGISCEGFDAFIFNVKRLANINIDQNICIGDTWWDYMFPLLYQFSGGHLFASKSPLLLHLDHPVQWSENQYLVNGTLTKDIFRNLLTKTTSNPDFLEADIWDFASFCFDYIRSAAPPLVFDHGPIGDRMRQAPISHLHNIFETAQKADKQHAIAMAAQQSEVSRRRQKGLANRRLGELLCTIAAPIRQSASALHSVGEDIQFRANVKDRGRQK